MTPLGHLASYREKLVLELLRDKSPRTTTEIRQAMGTAGGFILSIVNDLECYGYIAVLACSSAPEWKTCLITEKGKKCLQDIYDKCVERVKDAI